MITDLCGEEYTAIYGMAYSCGAIITVLITALNTAFAPWLGEKLHEDKLEEVRRFSYRYVLLFLYLAIGVILLGPEILLVLGGKSYGQSVYIMSPIVFGCMCQFLYAMFVNVEQFKRKTVGMAFASMTAAGINYALNYIFIRRYGYTAAAYTTAVSYLVLLLIHMLLVKQDRLWERYTITGLSPWPRCSWEWSRSGPIFCTAGISSEHFWSWPISPDSWFC